jgi:hypothetical protein
MTDETTELLIRARGFLERGWCRSAYARNFLGWKVGPKSWWACQWCALGALCAAGMPLCKSHPAVDQSHPAVNRLSAAIGGDYIGWFNDHQDTVEPVLAAFDRAIAMLAEG